MNEPPTSLLSSLGGTQHNTTASSCPHPSIYSSFYSSPLTSVEGSFLWYTVAPVPISTPPYHHHGKIALISHTNKGLLLLLLSCVELASQCVCFKSCCHQSPEMFSVYPRFDESSCYCVCVCVCVCVCHTPTHTHHSQRQGGSDGL